MDFEGRRADFDRANLVALQHIDMVDDYLTKHQNSIRKKYSDRGKTRTEGEIIREHNSSFAGWFKEKLKANPPPMISEDDIFLFALAHGPMTNLLTFQA